MVKEGNQESGNMKFHWTVNSGGYLSPRELTKWSEIEINTSCPIPKTFKMF